MTQELQEGFKEEMRGLLGEEESVALIEALDEAPEVSIRLNPQKTFPLPPDFPVESRVAWCPEGYYLKSRPSFTLMPELHAGAFYVQDASSMIHAHLLRSLPVKPDTLLDLCAAPGGKTTAMLSAIPAGCVAVANELMPARASVLKENIIKWGRPEVIVTSADAEKIGRSGISFDVIAADVPCSGEGMQRKDEEARRMWSPGLVAECASLQREIVANILPALRPGGYLIYSTCTFNREENEDNVRYFIEELGLENPPLPTDKKWGIAQSVDERLNALRFMPHLTRGEGLFVALLRKPEEESPRRSRRLREPRPLRHEASKWLSSPLSLYENGGRLTAMTPDCAKIAAGLADASVKILAAGVEVAELKGKDVVPSHALAVNSLLRRGVFKEHEVEIPEALDFLRRETILLPPDVPKGYVLLTHNGLPLGFLKNLGNRANNLYPKEWRIRIK